MARRRAPAVAEQDPQPALVDLPIGDLQPNPRNPSGSAIWHKQNGCIRSHPDFSKTPTGLGITARFQWLVENGMELLPEEKGGATVDGKTYRELPLHFHRLKASMNAPALV